MASVYFIYNKHEDAFMIKTSLNLKKSQVKKLIAVAKYNNTTISEIINCLANIALKRSNYKTKILRTTAYQENLSNCDTWHCQHVSFNGDIYEKCLDMRKFFKISVSLFISSAIDLYLKKLMKDKMSLKDSDNYTGQYIVFFSKFGDFSQITILWGMVEGEEIKQLQKQHTIPKET